LALLWRKDFDYQLSVSIPNTFPLLFVIIVAWRSREEIGACVRSIPRELTVDGVTHAVEVIVVDNSRNSDGTGDLLQREFPQVRYLLPPENLGFGRANNLGFRESSGECVLFLNPDTVCNEAALAHCLARVQADPEIGLISAKLVLSDGSMDLACRRSIPTIWDGFCRGSGLAARFPKTAAFAGYNLTHLPDDGTYKVGAINGAFMMGRREVFEQLAEPMPYGVFDDRFFMYGDDLDLCIRVARAGYKIIYDGRVQITHLKGQSVAKDYEHMSTAIFDANRDVYLKHFNPRNSRLTRWKYMTAFGLWKRVALLRAKLRGHQKVRPV
jgi:GT2 family glycosyltransferase